MTDNMTERVIADERATRQRKSNIRFLLGTILVVGAIAYLVFSSLENETYYYTVDEAAGQYAQLQGQEFRIKGNVVPGTHYLREGTLDEHVFTLVAADQTIEVGYHGALPDTFSDDAEVVALGTLEREGHFEATEVVAKCPSRYDSVAPTADETPES